MRPFFRQTAPPKSKLPVAQYGFRSETWMRLFFKDEVLIEERLVDVSERNPYCATGSFNFGGAVCLRFHVLHHFGA